MRKNIIIDILLTFLIIVLWSIMQSSYFQEKAPKPPVPEVKRENVLSKATETKEIKDVREKGRAPKVKEIPVKEISIETENDWAILTSDGDDR